MLRDDLLTARLQSLLDFLLLAGYLKFNTKLMTRESTFVRNRLKEVARSRETSQCSLLSDKLPPKFTHKKAVWIAMMITRQNHRKRNDFLEEFCLPFGGLPRFLLSFHLRPIIHWETVTFPPSPRTFCAHPPSKILESTHSFLKWANCVK